MCMTCGCDAPAEEHEHEHDHEHPHPHGDANGHGHAHPHEHSHANEAGDPSADTPGTRTVRMEQDVLHKNALIAERNRGWFAGRQVLALNLVSSPGAGKTTLLEHTIAALAAEMPFAVIEGDQQTDNDARRIQDTGAAVWQVNTGQVCHLDAQMVHDALHRLQPDPRSVVMIENVGNLVCPALFDLGEAGKVVVTSVTEGDDKPVKYPYMFRAAHLVLLNKSDLLPHVDFDVERFRALVAQVNGEVPVLTLSARSGEGLDAWYAWLRRERDVPHASEGNAAHSAARP